MPSALFTRRQLLQAATAGLFASAGLRAAGGRPRFETRGVVLTSDDFTLADWPERARRAGLTTLALHHSVNVGDVIRFVRSETGQRILARARELGLHIEYELHAIAALLPDELFEKDKTMFRADDRGERVPHSNMCVHSSAALEVVAERAVRLARVLRPTTGRYFYWGSDRQPWCRCAKCRGYSDSEQALIYENALIAALRRDDPSAQVAHLAYLGTLTAPRAVKPAPGVFLEYAPMERDYTRPYAEQVGTRDGLDHLDANLEVFPASTAQVLEYWIDVSMFSRWKRPAVKLPWRRDVFVVDLETYARRGIRHVTSFGVYLDADYVRRHGDPSVVIEEYGAGLGAAR